MDSKPGRPLTPQEGLARMQRWLDRVDELIFEAPKDIDRNTLLAIRAGIDLIGGYFRNAGWVNDGTTVNVDARSAHFESQLAGLTTEQLRSLADGLQSGKIDGQVLR